MHLPNSSRIVDKRASPSAPACIELTCLSDVGNYLACNEDFVFVAPFATQQTDGTTPEYLAIVCDGVGGASHGEVASHVAANTFFERANRSLHETGTPHSYKGKLELMGLALRYTHAQIIDYTRNQPETSGMASTFSALWIRENELILAHVGDSRIYRYRKGKLKQLSHDHSPVGRLREEGVISEAQARQHPYKNLVDQVLGGERPLSPQTSRHTFQKDDLILLCSDGLSDSLSDSDFHKIFHNKERESVEAIAQRLLETAKSQGGQDNISLIVARNRFPSNPFRQTIKRLFGRS